MSASRKILILSANPKGTSPLRLGEEVREIKEGLRRARSRDQFIIETAEAVRYRDIRRALLDINPQIVHFSGHGTGSQGGGLEQENDRKLSPFPEDTAEPEGLVFEDETGHVKLVDAEALAGLFALFTEQLECVLLNACYSRVQAEAIARHIPYVIGMKKAIGDKAAIEFAVGFYDALGTEKSYESAYEFGRNAISLAGIAEEDIPILLKAAQIGVTKGQQEETAVSHPQPITGLEYPTGSVSLDCPLYIERKEDALCYQEVEKPAALLQVKAPRQMGKSSLILRVENQAKKQGDDTAWIDFQLLDKERDLESLEKFLKWFCLSVTKKVGLSSQLFKEYWDSDLFGPKDNCDGYFREVLLAKRTNPLVLILEEVDNIFPYDNIAKGFFALLRAWHEAAKRREKAIEKLCLVLVYSTESYVVMESNSSPFNVGIPINLPEFTSEQVADLAGRHGLIWGREEMEKLREMVGGHPYLVRLAFYHIAKGDLTLDRILEMAPTDEGIYRDHFGRHLDTLERDSELKSAFQKVVASLQPVPLEKKLAFKLHGLGLVNLQSSPDHTINTVVLRYDKLYRPYFSDRLPAS